MGEKKSRSNNTNPVEIKLHRKLPEDSQNRRGVAIGRVRERTEMSHPFKLPSLGRVGAMYKSYCTWRLKRRIEIREFPI